MPNLEYLTDQNGQKKAVVIPIELWRKILPDDENSLDGLSEALEDYCLNQAIDEAQNTPLLDRQAALDFLEE